MFKNFKNVKNLDLINKIIKFEITPKIDGFEIKTVGSQFVADRNSVGFARKTALTISFVERGFERLGLDQ